jgi:hypothetical protein
VDLEQLGSAVNRMPVRIDNFPANVDGVGQSKLRRKKPQQLRGLRGAGKGI